MAKKGIHPVYKPATITCACGNKVETFSTRGVVLGRNLLQPATRSTRASRSSWTRPAASSASKRSTRWPGKADKARGRAGRRRQAAGLELTEPAPPLVPRLRAAGRGTGARLAGSAPARQARGRRGPLRRAVDDARRSGRAGEPPADAEAEQGALRPARAGRDAARVPRRRPARRPRRARCRRIRRCASWRARRRPSSAASRSGWRRRSKSC